MSIVQLGRGCSASPALTVPQPCTPRISEPACGQNPPGTQKSPLPAALPDGKTHHWFQLWQSFRLWANRGYKTNKPCAEWSVATTGWFQHGSSSAATAVWGKTCSPHHPLSHSCQGPSLSWDPSKYKTECYREHSPNFVMILKANEFLQGFPKSKMRRRKTERGEIRWPPTPWWNMEIHSHLTLSLYYLPFHSNQHCKGWAVSSQVSASVLLSDTVLQTLWNNNTAAKGTEVWTGSCNCTQKSSRSQTIRPKQHYNCEADVIYLGLYFIRTITSGPLGHICCISWSFSLWTRGLEYRNFT